ncbi:hypothetical protein ACFPAF_03915 [Hymenobacter endophyticus]|uniref:DUF4199 domain-containing protein n=1 Tax=Hymenobacter endophyticus TaxID=3076335 RepID=A0ABU3TDT2_9BACT|nr:hypothetical protein [Hymenobacter endophyticus]MDU0369529.1 hypothetical protein [Hymenobacter endophyticus]
MAAATSTSSSRLVILGAVLLLLGIVWGFALLRLATRTVVSAGLLWGVVLGTAGVVTGGLLWFFAGQRRRKQAPAPTIQSVLITAVLLYLYSTVAFGMLAAVLLLASNQLLASGPTRHLLLPVQSTSVPGAEDAYAAVLLDGYPTQVALPEQAGRAVLARYLALELEQGAWGFWVVRSAKPQMLAPNP